jgi:hypothetical protein
VEFVSNYIIGLYTAHPKYERRILVFVTMMTCAWSCSEEEVALAWTS